MNLDDLRNEIDIIDDQLLELLKKRMECSLNVAKVKHKENIPVLNSNRENQILDKIKEKSGKEYAPYFAAIWRNIMETSRELQHDKLDSAAPLEAIIQNARKKDIAVKTVACQGVDGAFSSIASRAYFPDVIPGFYKNFSDVFEAVQNGVADAGILPIENSTAGSVLDVYDLIAKYHHSIIGAMDMKIEQNLLVKPGTKLEDIKRVCSHPQGLAQCADLIEKRGYIASPMSNTAAAAKFVSESEYKGIAAIGSKSAAEIYGLSVLEESIENVINNTTRFIVISKNMVIDDDSNKISITFRVPHTQGSLCKVLSRFSDRGLNITKIESRAVGGNFEYLFYLDFEGNLKDERITKLLAALSLEMPSFSFLGNYKEISI